MKCLEIARLQDVQDGRILHQIPKGFWEPWAAPKPPAVSNEPPSENFCLRACKDCYLENSSMLFDESDDQQPK